MLARAGYFILVIFSCKLSFVRTIPYCRSYTILFPMVQGKTLEPMKWLACSWDMNLMEHHIWIFAVLLWLLWTLDWSMMCWNVTKSLYIGWKHVQAVEAKTQKYHSFDKSWAPCAHPPYAPWEGRRASVRRKNFPTNKLNMTILHTPSTRHIQEH